VKQEVEAEFSASEIECDTASPVCNIIKKKLLKKIIKKWKKERKKKGSKIGSSLPVKR